MDEWSAGGRIAQHRMRRGLTQEELAGLVGISLSMMKKIESGDRLVTRFTQLVAFAQALRMKDLRDLTGVPLSLLPSGRPGHPAAEAVGAALMNRGGAPAGRADLDELGRRVEAAWQSWQAPSSFRYDAVGQQLPALLEDTQSAIRTVADPERRRALRIASSLYQLTRTWTKRISAYELSLVAADRSVSCALDADDPQLVGVAAWNLAMILSAQGKTEQSRAIVTRALAEAAAWSGPPTQASLAVIGGLHLMGATEAARADDGAEAARLLDQAEELARRTGETNHYRIAFGPTNVAVHRVSTAAELGRTSDALTLAERVPIHETQVVERRLTFHLDLARCYTRQRNDVAAVHMLERIERDSPEELRYSSLARETLRILMGRMKPALVGDIRPLLAAAGLPD